MDMSRTLAGGSNMTAAERKKARQRPALMSADLMDRIAAESQAYFAARAAERAAAEYRP
ncbi:hypothetical protein D3C80_1724890 [compost metagenome]